MAGRTGRQRRADPGGTGRPGPAAGGPREPDQRDPRGSDARPGGAGPLPRADGEHRGAGCLGAAPGAARRARRRGVRRHGGRPPRRAARRRVDGGPVHQHTAGPRPAGRRTAAAPAPRGHPGAADRAHVPPAPGAGRDPETGRARGGLRHPGGVRELSGGARRGDRSGRLHPALPRRPGDLPLPLHPGRRAGRADALQARLPPGPVRPPYRRSRLRPAGAGAGAGGGGPVGAGGPDRCPGGGRAAPGRGRLERDGRGGRGTVGAGAVRPARGGGAGRRGRPGRAADADVRRAGRRSGPAGRVLERCGRAARRPGRGGAGTVRRPGGGAAGGVAGRGGVRAGGRRVSGGTDRVHAGRRAAGGGAVHGGDALGGAGRRGRPPGGAGHAGGRGVRRPGTRTAAHWRRHGVCDVHLRLHRRTEGRVRTARERGGAGRQPRLGARPGRRGADARPARLRRVAVRDLGATGGRRPRRGGTAGRGGRAAHPRGRGGRGDGGPCHGRAVPGGRGGRAGVLRRAARGADRR